MPKSVFLLLFFVLPFVGMAQSARKTNKLLKQEYASKRQEYAAALLAYDSLAVVCDAIGIDCKESWILFSTKLSEARSVKVDAQKLYQTAESLGINQSFAITYQTVDTIIIPEELKMLKEISLKYEGLNRLNKRSFELEMDDLSVPKQNELLITTIAEMKQVIDEVQTMNTKLITALPQIKVDIDLLMIEASRWNLIAQDLKIHINYLEEQLQLAKNKFAQKGPKGFNDNYFRTFPDVFPDNPLSQEMIHEEFIDFGEEVMPVPEPDLADRRDEVYYLVDESADFPGGMAKLKEYMKANLMYPETALELGIEGKCYLQFIVSAKGNISNVKVIRGIPDCPECDKEAIRLTKAMPNWTPGKINGEPVNSLFNLPISFKQP